VCFYDPLRNGETESDAALVILARLPELIEEVLDLLRRYSRTGVAYLEDDLLFARRSSERHITAFGRELDRVRQQVAENLRDAHRISAHADAVVARVRR